MLDLIQYLDNKNLFFTIKDFLEIFMQIFFHFAFLKFLSDKIINSILIDFNRCINEIICLAILSTHCHQTRHEIHERKLVKVTKFSSLRSLSNFPLRYRICAIMEKKKKAVEKCFRANWRVLIDKATKSWI